MTRTMEAERKQAGRMARIWCFGDSNTYGYDPRSCTGGRYPARWPELMADETGFRVFNDGQNGRMIPCRTHELQWFHRDAARYGADVLVVMLGTNDLLNGADAGETAKRMEAFLGRCGMSEILLIGPPPMRRGAWVPDDQLVAESAELSRRYRILAKAMTIPFANAGEWNIDLAYDGVHFTEEGHLRFARGIAERLGSLLRREDGATGRYVL